MRYKFYGRRAGKTLTQKKKLILKNKLELFRINVNHFIKDLDFFNEYSNNEIVLEIGFGSGENLLNLLSKTKNTIFIGSELFKNGIANFLSSLDGSYHKRMKIFNDDVRILLDKLPDKVFSRIFILFPDPWPKKKHKKRRLISSKSFSLLSNALKDNGILYISTDVEDYFSDIRKILLLNKYNIINSSNYSEKPRLIAKTKYLSKAKINNKKIYYLVAKKLLDKK